MRCGDGRPRQCCQAVKTFISISSLWLAGNFQPGSGQPSGTVRSISLTLIWRVKYLGFGLRTRLEPLAECWGQGGTFSPTLSEPCSQGQAPQSCALGKFITVPRGRLNVGMGLLCLLRTRPLSSLRRSGAGPLRTEDAGNILFSAAPGILINLERDKKTPLGLVCLKCQVQPVYTDIRPRERRPQDRVLCRKVSAPSDLCRSPGMTW